MTEETKKTETKVINESSVSVEKNSRGVTYSIKAYGETTEEIEKKLTGLQEIAVQKAKQLQATE